MKNPKNVHFLHKKLKVLIFALIHTLRLPDSESWKRWKCAQSIPRIKLALIGSFLKNFGSKKMKKHCPTSGLFNTPCTYRRAIFCLEVEYHFNHLTMITYEEMMFQAEKSIKGLDYAIFSFSTFQTFWQIFE